MASSVEPQRDKRRRGPRAKMEPDPRTGLVKRSFYVLPSDYQPFIEATGGDVSGALPLAMTAWLALDGNTQEFIKETRQGRTMTEAVKILREKLPEKMADMLVADYVKKLPLGRKTELIREARKKA